MWNNIFDSFSFDGMPINLYPDLEAGIHAQRFFFWYDFPSCLMKAKIWTMTVRNTIQINQLNAPVRTRILRFQNFKYIFSFVYSCIMYMIQFKFNFDKSIRLFDFFISETYNILYVSGHIIWFIVPSIRIVVQLYKSLIVHPGTLLFLTILR